MEFLIAALVILLFLLIATKVYFKLSLGWCRSQQMMTGKTVIITGSNTGIGKETARDLARRGARVILAVRSLKRGEEAAQDIKESTGNPNILVKECDLSSLASVRTFASNILKTESHLHVLVLNAGMVPPPGKHLTQDGLELQFVSNHLGHFLLTNLLLDLIKRSAPSRIVIVSSLLHHLGRIDFDNLCYQKSVPDPFFTYCMSKLCNILMMRQLTHRLQGSGVTVNSCHPGLVRTQINRQTPWYITHLIQPISYIWAKDPVEGAQTTVFLSVSEEVSETSGQYFSDCRKASCSASSMDLELSAKLWAVSERLTQECINSTTDGTKEKQQKMRRHQPHPLHPHHLCASVYSL